MTSAERPSLKKRQHKPGNAKRQNVVLKYTTDDKKWDKLVLGVSDSAHYMQSSTWGKSKALNHWPVRQVIIQDKKQVIPIQVYTRTAPGFGKMHYAPEVTGIKKDNLAVITNQLKKQFAGGVAVKLELFQPYSEDLLNAFKANGWKKCRSIQPRNTVIVNLSGSEEELFASIKKRARYEVRVAQRNNVRVEKVETTTNNFDKLADLMDITSRRAGAFFRSRTYLNNYWYALAAAGQGSLYFAYHEQDLLAGAFVITFGKSAWYRDGGSVRLKSEFMAPRYLQWEIMRDLQTKGIKQYDLSGIPAPENLDNSPIKSLMAFKTGFSKEAVKSLPAMELPLSKRYALWPKAEPQLFRVHNLLYKDFWY